VDVRHIPILRKTRGQRIKRRGKRAHRRGEHPRDHQPAHARRHLMQDVERERMRLAGFVVVRPEQDADGQKAEHDGEIGQAGEDQCQAAFGEVFRGQHPLHHVLVGPVGRHGQKRRAEDGRPDRVFRPEHRVDILEKRSIGIRAGIEEDHVLGALEACHRALPAAGDDVQQRPDRKAQRTKHDGRLNHIRPNHSLDPAERRVNRSGGSQQGERADVDPDLLQRRELHPGDHLVAEYQHHRRHVEARAAGQRAGDQEHGGRAVFRPVPEADQQELVDRDHAVVVVGLDENEGNNDARQHGADGELGVGVVAQSVALVGRAQESRGADLRREDGRQHGPPRNAPVANGESLHRFIAPALVQADADHNDKVCEDHPAIEQPFHMAAIIHGFSEKTKKQSGAGRIKEGTNLSHHREKSVVAQFEFSLAKW